MALDVGCDAKVARPIGPIERLYLGFAGRISRIFRSPFDPMMDVMSVDLHNGRRLQLFRSELLPAQRVREIKPPVRSPNRHKESK